MLEYYLFVCLKSEPNTLSGMQANFKTSYWLSHIVSEKCWVGLRLKEAQKKAKQKQEHNFVLLC